jgi:NADPH:quinone reductase-like Zn-dependent oxidoreductase
MKAIQIEVFGNPAEVVKAVDVPDVGAPAAGEVVIAVEASPINQYDLLMIAGAYFRDLDGTNCTSSRHENASRG